MTAPGNAPQEAVVICPVHGIEHQPREREVRCQHLGCRRMTPSPHALCEAHDLEVSTT